LTQPRKVDAGAAFGSSGSWKSVYATFGEISHALVRAGHTAKKEAK